MAHTRIRPFNTSKTYPEQNLDNDLSQGVVAANIIFLRGQIAQDLDSAENIAVGDPVAQTHRVMQNIKQLIEEGGGKMEHLTKLVVYLTDIRHREDVYRTMGEYIKNSTNAFPFSSLRGIISLLLAINDYCDQFLNRLPMDRDLRLNPQHHQFFLTIDFVHLLKHSGTWCGEYLFLF